MRKMKKPAQATNEVERVARAICMADKRLNPDILFWDGRPCWALYEEHARAAIDAMTALQAVISTTGRSDE